MWTDGWGGKSQVKIWFWRLFLFLTLLFDSPSYEKSWIRHCIVKIRATKLGLDPPKWVTTSGGGKLKSTTIYQDGLGFITMAFSIKTTHFLNAVTFFKQILMDTYTFMGPLMHLFWTSGDVSSGFQSQGRQFNAQTTYLCHQWGRNKATSWTLGTIKIRFLNRRTCRFLFGLFRLSRGLFLLLLWFVGGVLGSTVRFTSWTTHLWYLLLLLFVAKCCFLLFLFRNSPFSLLKTKIAYAFSLCSFLKLTQKFKTSVKLWGSREVCFQLVAQLSESIWTCCGFRCVYL